MITFNLGEPMSPISIAGIVGKAAPPARLFFPLDDSSRLILIIGIQSSSKPSPPLPPAGQDFAPPAPLRAHPPAAQPAGMDSAIPPASKTPAAKLPSSPEPSPTLRRDKSFQCARLPRWRGRNRMSSEFPAR